MSTLAEYRARISSHVNDVTDTQVNQFLADAISELNVAAWGTKYSRAVVYLAAHYAEMDRRANHDSRKGSGAVVGENPGGDAVGVSYGAITGMKGSDRFLVITPFGVTFVGLRASLPLTPMSL